MIILLVLAALIALIPLFTLKGAKFGGSDDAGSAAVSEITGSEYQRGALIKGGITLETAGKVTTICLDKTGTLTVGRPQVVEIQPFASYTQEEVLSTAALAEKRSEHPLASAVMNEAKRRKLSIPDPQEWLCIVKI